MSLVGLKNLIFKQAAVIPSAKTEHGGLLSKGPRSTYGAVDGSDIESQEALEKSAEKKAFRVDARVISDATIGLSDGLTVPFALTAGLSALGSTKVVIYGGFAELIAGAISMGLGGYLAAKSEAASYNAQRAEAFDLVENDPQQVKADITQVFAPFHLPAACLQEFTGHIMESPRLLDFVMQFQHCAEAPAASRAFTSALTIALAYFLGGLLPLIPYFFFEKVGEGLLWSMAMMAAALFAFGYVKTCAVSGWGGAKNIREAVFGGVQMVIVGGVAASSAMGLVKLFNEQGV